MCDHEYELSFPGAASDGPCFSEAGDVSTEAEVRHMRWRKEAVITRRLVPLSGQEPDPVNFGSHERSRSFTTWIIDSRSKGTERLTQSAGSRSWNLTLFDALLKDLPIWCQGAVLTKLLLKNPQSTISLPKRIQDSHKKPVLPFSCSCQQNKGLKKQHLKFPNLSWKKWMDSPIISSEESTWTTVQLLRKC